jgi:predicted nucleotidyltransferase
MSYLKSKYNQKFIRDNNLIIAEAVIGSHAFNLHNEKSDVDMYGIFYLHKDDFFSLNHRVDTGFKDVVEKENPHDDDITYMEIGKFFELLNNNNPNVLELASAIIKQDFGGMIENLDMSKILSKKCEKSFGDYAIAQIKKARGLNKKIVNPVGEVRKTPLDFCRLMDNGQTYELRKWLEKRNLDQKFCGVVNLSNARDSYGLYYDWVSHDLFSGIMNEDDVEEMKTDRRGMNLPMGHGFKGIENEDGKSNEIRLSSIPKDWDKYVSLHIKHIPNHPDEHPNIEFLGNISYNKDGYIKHCKDYEQYWKWVENRNPERYNNNLKQNYDTKNISHCVRLLSVAKEIGEGKGLILKRTDDRQFLMDIKYGKVEYEVAMAYAENIMKDLPELYKNSNLPDVPDYEYLNHALIEYRKSFY